MSFVAKSLTSDEVILYRSKLHWIIFLRPVLCGATTVGLFVVTFKCTSAAANENADALVALIGFFLLAVVVAVTTFGVTVSTIIRHATTEFVITNKRVLAKTGLVHREFFELLLNKIESIHISQNYWGMLLDFGTVSLCGTGGTKGWFRGIVSPLEFRKRMQEQIQLLNTLGTP